MKKVNPNYHRLTVQLNNLEHKKEFKTTYTYQNKPNSSPITSISEAISAVLTLHSDGLETAAELSRKIKKVVFNGVEIQQFHDANSHTDNGWIVK